MSQNEHNCPDCRETAPGVDRRDFLKTAGAVVAVGSVPGLVRSVSAGEAAQASTPESIVGHLYESLTPGQREKICFDWNYMDPERGLLRTRVANNWQITEPAINDDFYTDDQRQMILDIFHGIVRPEWHERYAKQMEDDCGGFGFEQSIAIFGTPGEDQCEFVLTGRHMTLRADGNSQENVAFGGPIFYGHAADGFDEGAKHPGNVFWPQAVAANRVFEMLDGKQRELALVKSLPAENAVAFRAGGYPGMPVSEMSSDQQEEVGKVLAKLIEPYRAGDQKEALECLAAQGGLDKCSLAFYQDGDIGDDKVWDCWRLEGPAFVWYFRGAPHVHVWVNVASNPSVKTNS
ncbi:MAG: DUF3500 domain-containing protein [Pirellulales bacterium]